MPENTIERYKIVRLETHDLDNKKIVFLYSQERPCIFYFRIGNCTYAFDLGEFIEQYVESLGNNEDLLILSPDKKQTVITHIRTSIDSLVLRFLMEAEKFDALLHM